MFFLLHHLLVSMLPLCDDPVLLGQPYYAHEVHGSPQVCAVNPQRLEALVKGNYIFFMKSLLILNTDYSLTPILPDLSLLPDDKYFNFVTYFSLDFSQTGLPVWTWCVTGLMCFRSNLRGLYKGDIYKICNNQKTMHPSRPGVVCWMGLTGYQAAIVSLGKAWINGITDFSFKNNAGKYHIMKRKKKKPFRLVLLIGIVSQKVFCPKKRTTTKRDRLLIWMACSLITMNALIVVY